MKHLLTTTAWLLSAAIGTAAAQTPTPTAAPIPASTTTRPTPAATPTAPQNAPADLDPNALAGAGLQVLQAVDRQQVGGLWDGASAVAQRATKRDEFVTRVLTSRKALGPIVGRAWTVVRRQQVAEGEALPAGLYGSIEFASQFQDGKLHRELVSIRRDADGVWRFAGYVVE